MEVQSQSAQPMSSLVSRSKLKTPKSRGSVAFQGPIPKTPTVRKVSMIPGSAKEGARKSSTAGGDFRKASNAEMSETSESVSNMDFRAKTARMVQPTYQLKPTSNFSGTQINKIASDLLDLYLNDVTYSPELCRQKSKEIARAITDAIKKLGLTRYKVLTVVNIGNLNDFSTVKIASRSVWDEKTDKFTTAEFYNKTLYAVAMIYTLYTD